jgi:hypothetical protein
MIVLSQKEGGRIVSHTGSDAPQMKHFASTSENAVEGIALHSMNDARHVYATFYKWIARFYLSLYLYIPKAAIAPCQKDTDINATFTQILASCSKRRRVNSSPGLAA